MAVVVAVHGRSRYSSASTTSVASISSKAVIKMYTMCGSASDSWSLPIECERHTLTLAPQFKISQRHELPRGSTLTDNIARRSKYRSPGTLLAERAQHACCYAMASL